jgi:hypothetical protein
MKDEDLRFLLFLRHEKKTGTDSKIMGMNRYGTGTVPSYGTAKYWYPYWYH